MNNIIKDNKINYYYDNSGNGIYYDITMFHHNETTLLINSIGSIDLIGTEQDAAIALWEHVKDQYSDGLSSLIINNVLEINLNNFNLKHLNNDKPHFFDYLNKEFKRICNLRAFW